MIVEFLGGRRGGGPNNIIPTRRYTGRSFTDSLDDGSTRTTTECERRDRTAVDGSERSVTNETDFNGDSGHGSVDDTMRIGRNGRLSAYRCDG